MRRGRAVAVAAPLALVGPTVGVLAGGADRADAHPVVYLWGDDEDLLSTSAVNQGNVVALWQSLLDSLNLGIAVDGFFGPQTAGATSRFDTEFAPPPNGQVEDGAGQSWNAMAADFVQGDSCDSSFCYYHAGGGGVTPATRLALNRSNLNWKWRGDCVSGASWHDSNHPTIDVAGTC